MKNCIEKYLHYSLDIKQRKIKKRFATSIEKNINGKKKFVFSLLENEIKFIEDKDIWVTPSIPLIVFLLFGYIVNIFMRIF